LPAACLVVLAAWGCNDSSDSTPPGPKPQIVTAVGPKDGVVGCDPTVSGGVCPLPITITFRLAEPEIVTKAFVRFQGDGTDVGIDHGYSLPNVPGKGENVDVPVTITSSIPPTILRKGALFTYSVRLVTGTGQESTPSTLTISVQ
jgi:hypothetical protein